MRKSTLIALGIVVLTFAGMLWALGFYTDQVRYELETAGEWTQELRESGDAAPESHVKLRRLKGALDGSTADPAAFGLIIEVTPSAAALANDLSGSILALRLARSAFEKYGPERPITWVKVRSMRADGSEPTLAFGKGEGGYPVALSLPPTPTKPPR